MSDLISRKALLDEFQKLFTVEEKMGICAMRLSAIKQEVHCVIMGLPSAQPEIIRCKDCKDYQEGFDIDGKPFSRCNGSIRTYGQTSPNWFCADAERKNE